MKDIYDEAIEELQNYINEYGMDYYGTKHYPVTIKALERAKKEHELLGLYQKRDKFSGYKETYKSITSEIQAIEEEMK